MIQEGKPDEESREPQEQEDRPPAKPMPEPIPDTPENIMRAIVNAPPKKDEDKSPLTFERHRPGRAAWTAARPHFKQPARYR